MEPVLQIRSKTSAVLKNPCLNTMLEELYKQRHETGDIKFAIGYEEIYAHRNILAALSPKYKAQFYGGMAEKDVIRVHDVAAGAFNEFLQFFYAENVTLTIENIEDVLNLAKQSLVDDLLDGCIHFLKNMVEYDEEKLLWCYQLALRYETKELEEFCVDQIRTTIKSVLQMADFLSCDRDILSRILALDPLSCIETDVFRGCISWARKRCEQDGLDATNPVDLRTALGEELYKIRFCSMNAEEFATISTQFPELLSTQESTEVFQAIVLKSKGVTSAIFGELNKKKREPSQSSSLECSFSTGPPIPFRIRCGNDYMTFKCTKTIKLIGFVIHNKIDDNIEVFVQIESNGKHQILEYITSFLEIETEITFARAIQVEKDKWCEISIRSETLAQTNTDLYGFKIEKVVEQNDVSFEFKYCDVSNLMTRLLFKIVD